MSKIRVSVILPTYNEAGNIVQLVEELQKELTKETMTHEVIIVDDNSPDKTGLLVQKYFAKMPNVRALIRKKDRGLAKSIRHGIEHAVGTIIVVMDTDFNHEPRLVPRLVKKMKRYDIAVGSRFVRGGGMANTTRELLSRVFNLFLIQPIIGSSVQDNLSGFFAMEYTKLESLDFDEIFYGYGDYFIRLLYYVHQKEYNATEVPTYYKDRVYGESKSQFLEMFRDYFLSAVELRFRK